MEILSWKEHYYNYLLDQPELVIVPDRALYKVPFAALRDEKEKYLAESFRIRIVPSLTTLKLMQDSQADYHSQTGALIVGDPEVGDVFYKVFFIVLRQKGSRNDWTTARSTTFVRKARN